MHSPLLSGCVPDLQCGLLPVHQQLLYLEVNPGKEGQSGAAPTPPAQVLGVLEMSPLNSLVQSCSSKLDLPVPLSSASTSWYMGQGDTGSSLLWQPW